jgi:type VI secretion system protein ImpG
MRDELLRYYEDELSYLRQSGAQFAETYPKIASRLRLEASKESEDPHVERLVEAFAFLAARIHLRLDDDFPEIAEALLGMVYPHLVRPIPSMAIADFQLDIESGKLTTGLKIKRGSTLYSKPVGGVPCKFRTCYETTLWPMSVTAAEWKTPDVFKPAVKAADAAGALRLEIHSAPDAPLASLGLDCLRLHLAGAGNVVHPIYELLCSRLLRVVVRAPNNPKIPTVVLPASSLRPVGFAEDEGMFPYHRRSFAGYRLLQELFTIPAKFLFVEITGLERIWAGGFENAAELIFLFPGPIDEERRQRLEIGVTPSVFRPGCVPVVNLFSQTAEPILLDQYKHEYQVIPDARRPQAIEIFSVDEVSTIDSNTREIVTYQPFHSSRSHRYGSRQECFWIASRRPSSRPHDDASEIYLSVVDRSMRTLSPGKDTLTVRTTCTNRNLPAQLPFGNPTGDFELEGNTPVKRIVSLTEPTRPVRPPMGGLALWRLVSHLSLNYLSLVEGGCSALQQILRLYDFSQTPAAERLIQGIVAVNSTPHFARVVTDAGIAFARGTRVELELDESQFVGSGVYLFASVIEQFLALYTSLNSFTQVTAKTRQRKGEILREWPPRAGRKILL